MANTFDAGLTGPFRVEVQWQPDDDWGFTDFGHFCETGRRYGEDVRVRNDPTGGDFYLRSPGAWRKADIGNGTDSWVRADRSVYGWFKLADHPRHEVAAVMQTEGLTEREAWQKVLDRLNEYVAKIANNEITMVDVIVEAYWGNLRVGHVRCAVESESYITNEKMLALVRENDLIDEVLAEAQANFQTRSENAAQGECP